MGAGPQESSRIAKLKSDALKIVSQIAPLKLSVEATLADKNFKALPKPLSKKMIDAKGVVYDMSDEANLRASGVDATPLPFTLEDVKDAVKTCALGGLRPSSRTQESALDLIRTPPRGVRGGS